MSRWSNYFYTVARLRPVQIRYQLSRRLLPAPKPRRDSAFGVVRHDLAGFESLAPVQPLADDDSIEFLNVQKPFNEADFDWRAAGMSKLWRYNLHYFDYLQWDHYDEARKCWLIGNWIDSNPVGTADAWEPYPVSLRVVNWIKYCFSRPADAWPNDLSTSLAQQLLWLEANLEYHVLANHFLKNGKALLFGGVFFEGPSAARLFDKGMNIMLEEAAEQFLEDGGHFERSPQYHCICTEDYLDAVALLEANPGLATSTQLSVLRRAALRALDALEQLVAGDERMPLFNDCAFGIAPEPSALLGYGTQVLGKTPTPRESEPLRIHLPDSGYFGYRFGGDSFFIDCGEVGPGYQPGHAHCDTLSYELCIDGQRVVVDSGVYEYAAGEMRSYVRSTAAHNTVSVDDYDQSEVWGEFRVARRASPIVAELSEWVDGRLHFHGAHNGYRRLPGGVTHQRQVVLDPAGSWRVDDAVTGRGSHEVRSFIHLHPEIELQAVDERQHVLLKQGHPIASIDIDDGCTVSRETGWYCPEFGRRDQNEVLVLSSRGALPLKLGYEIRKAARGS